MKSEALAIRPYARLLTMLGDQLIKNDRIALVELIKNSYDADAESVEVHFENFNDDMSHNANSRIIVRDDGVGMKLETVRNAWMNPAAPQKFLDKLDGSERTPIKKRVIQGEKGIGRFAVLKLGKVVTVTTRTEAADSEIVLVYDFSRFDDDFVREDGKRRDIFLDEIKIDCRRSEPVKLPGVMHGTVIEIEQLKGAWSESIIERLCRDISNLTDPVSRVTGRTTSDHFAVSIVCNGRSRSVEAADVEILRSLIEDKSVLKIGGHFDPSTNTFSFETEAGGEEISLEDAKITGLWVWRARFRWDRPRMASEQKYNCGPFGFRFYIFDFSRGINGRYALTQEEKNLLKKYRVYLYRDNVRVYPYGDPEDDWLSIDTTRGVGRAGHFFSNDQIVGWIDITHRNNPDLRDKTNREGLIETGGAARDLIFLVQTFLSYVKQHPYEQYQQKQRRRNNPRLTKANEIAQRFAELRKDLQSSGSESSAAEVARLEAIVSRETEYLSQRAETTEDLAGVGLSVEMASHDIMLLMNRAQDIGRQLARAADKSLSDEVRGLADMLLGVLQQIIGTMQDVQVLFKSSRRRRKVLRVEPILDKIHQIYNTLLEQRQIRYLKVTTGISPLVANTTDGVVMQVLINLFDNAAYWLESVDSSKREIRVTVDGNNGELIFSDSGPGIETEDLPYIFEPFYSGKGQEGRGLGLYIARQLLERHGYRIAPADESRRVLSGANFVVSFVKEKD